MEEKWSVEKLDGPNWVTWKFQLRHLLMAKGLWKFVDGTAVLADGASEEDREKFRTEQQKAFSTIVMALSSSLLYLVTSCELPNDAWNTLKKHFERDTLANKLFLKKQYFRKEMSEGTSINAHLKEMKMLADKLALIGAPVSEEDQVVTLLGSLPASFATVVTALEARGDGTTMDYVQESLIHHEQKLKFKEIAPPSQQDTALLGQRRKGAPVCWNCNEVGHVQRHCPKKKGKLHGAAVTTEEESDLDDSRGEGAFVTPTFAGGAWLVDSGASSHMTPSKEYFASYEAFDRPEKVHLGDGRVVEAVGAGNIQLKMVFKVSRSKPATMYDVLYVPKLSCSLFSVRAAAKRGNQVKFSQEKCWIRDSKGQLRGMGTLVDKLYQLDCEVRCPSGENAAAAIETNDLWHQRLGHLNNQQLHKMVKDDRVSGIKLSPRSGESICEGCVVGKMQRKPFKAVDHEQSTKKLELVHSDVCGPIQVGSIGGSRYFATFIDDYSHCVSVYFLKHKSEVLSKFKEFESIVTNESGERIVRLRTDNGGEYVSTDFQEYLKSKGIQHELTVPYSPQQNGIAERMNRTLMESARSMMLHANLPNRFWAEAIATAAYLRNRSATAALEDGVTPYEKWHDRKPNLKHLRVFGCAAFAHVPDCNRRKLDGKAIRLRFVGYSKNPKGYRLHDEQTDKVITRRDVTFDESNFLLRSESLEVLAIPTETVELQQPESTDNGNPEQREDTSQQGHHSDSEPQDRRPERVRNPPIRYGDWVSHVATCEHFAYNVCQVPEPKSLDEALSGPHAKEWKEAADSEYQSLMENGTWDLVELPEGREAIGSKWVFKVKHDSCGKVERFKGRLVAKGYSQKYGIDFEETFAPVVRFSSIRALLAFAINNNMSVHQMDVVTAFLNGELQEEIYMQQPAGYEIPGKEMLVCKLKKSLYGLKQSPRCWNKSFQDFMLNLQFKPSSADPCVFIQAGIKSMAIVAVYVDDLIVMSTIPEELNAVKKALSGKFRMKDMGPLHYCLGVSVVQNAEGIWLHQKQYILSMLQKYGLMDAKPVSTPADLSVKLVKDDGVSKQLKDKARFQSMVGSLLYAAMATRPDIAQAVGAVSKFCAQPTEAHITAVKRIFRYLGGTKDLALRYKRSKDQLTGYSDSDWAGDHDDRHSTSGNVFVFGNGAITWTSKKQAVVALSTSEAEYIALSAAAQEAAWLQKLFSDLLMSSQPIVMMEDNQGAIALAKNPIAHSRTKHIDIRFHFIREAQENGVIQVCYCPTEEMLADIFTKPLPRHLFERLRKLLGMEHIIM